MNHPIRLPFAITANKREEGCSYFSGYDFRNKCKVYAPAKAMGIETKDS